jgi:HK97 family phage portal protein
MTWWQRFFERRAVPTWNTSQSAADFTALFDTATTAAGVTVTPENSLSVPAVFSCCQVLSQDIARTPIRLRQQVAEDTYVDAVNHPLYEILYALPNPEQTAFQVKSALMWSLLTYGKAYAEIVRQDGRVSALWPLDARLMRVDRTPARIKRWRYDSGGQTYTWLFDASQPPIFELVHETPISRCRELIATALALQQFTAKFFANEGRPSGVLQLQGPMNQAISDRLGAQWRALFGSGGTQRRGIAVLDSGAEFKPIAPHNDESQLNETWAALNQMIAGAFRVPTWKVGDLSKTSYANMEAGALDYVTSTLDPFFQLWEDAIRRDLLTTRQYSQYQIVFDRSALLRSDTKSLHDSLATGRNTGYLSANDCRRALGLNPIPDAEADAYLVNSALVPIGAPREPTVA